MVIAKDSGANVGSGKPIFDVLRWMNFGPDGHARVPLGLMSSQTRDILSEMNKFMANRPKARRIDYFLELGMTCNPVASATVEVARCEIEWTIQVRCYSTNESQSWGSPLPEELQEPLPARLHWQVDVSRSALLGTGVQVFAVPGGRLCHR